MTIISADGQEVQPVEQQRFLIAVAETYDVLVKVPLNGAYELRATAHDASGYASVWLGSGDRFPASDIPKPNLYQSMHHGSVSSMWALTPAGVMGMTDEQVAAGRFDKPGMMDMQDMPMQNGHGMGQEAHMVPGSSNMPAEDEPMHKSQNPPATDVTGSHEMTDMKKTAHAVQNMSEVHDSDRQGKKYAGDYRLMVSDVSSGKDLAADGSWTPWPNW